MENNGIKKELTDNEIEEICEAARSENIIDMGKYKDNSKAPNIEAADIDSLNADELQLRIDKETEELEAMFEMAEAGKELNTADIVTKTVDKMPAANVSLFDLDGDAIPNRDQTRSINISGFTKDTFDLDEDEVMEFLSVIDQMNKNEKYPVYKNLPEKIKRAIREIALEGQIPANYYDRLARMVVNEFVSDTDVEGAFVDLENALNEALNMPSIIDIYTDHMKTVMEENIPKMVDQIKDEYPEKAELLLKVKEAFKQSYTFTMAKEAYDNNTLLRKAIRRSDREIKRSLDYFNFKNEKSNFKMNDVTQLPTVLNKVLITDLDSMTDTGGEEESGAFKTAKRIRDLEITNTDIEKFCVLVSKSCEEMDPKDIVDASYMYYMMKNIIVLQFTKEAKTEFADELINNICDTIVFIRNKEAGLNAESMDKSKL